MMPATDTVVVFAYLAAIVALAWVMRDRVRRARKARLAMRKQ
jgi:hypothetical protein